MLIKLLATIKSEMFNLFFPALQLQSFDWNLIISLGAETALDRCSYEKVLWRYVVNLEENTMPMWNSWISWNVEGNFSSAFKLSPKKYCDTNILIY